MQMASSFAHNEVTVISNITVSTKSLSPCSSIGRAPRCQRGGSRIETVQGRQIGRAVYRTSGSNSTCKSLADRTSTWCMEHRALDRAREGVQVAPRCCPDQTGLAADLFCACTTGCVSAHRGFDSPHALLMIVKPGDSARLLTVRDHARWVIRLLGVMRHRNAGCSYKVWQRPSKPSGNRLPRSSTLPFRSKQCPRSSTGRAVAFEAIG